MPHPPAVCSTHGLFLAELIDIPVGVSATINYSGAKCPQCDRTGVIPNGTYLGRMDDLGQAVLELVGSSITFGRARQISHALTRLQQAKPQDFDEAVLAVAPVAPDVAAMLLTKRNEQGWSRSDVLALVSVLLTAFGIYVSGGGQDHITEEHVRQVVQESIDRSALPPSSPRSPTPPTTSRQTAPEQPHLPAQPERR